MKRVYMKSCRSTRDKLKPPRRRYNQATMCIKRENVIKKNNVKKNNVKKDHVNRFFILFLTARTGTHWVGLAFLLVLKRHLVVTPKSYTCRARCSFYFWHPTRTCDDLRVSSGAHGVSVAEWWGLLCHLQHRTPVSLCMLLDIMILSRPSTAWWFWWSSHIASLW